MIWLKEFRYGTDACLFFKLTHTYKYRVNLGTNVENYFNSSIDFNSGNHSRYDLISNEGVWGYTQVEN